MNITTWNMQGAKHSTENKWNEGVKPLLRSQTPTPVLCLQECGTVPASAQLIDTFYFPLNEEETDRVDLYAWGGTEDRPAYYIFFHNWDSGGHRVNSAIVTDSLPTRMNRDILLMSPQAGAVWRPALGVKCQGTWVFSFHAISPGGPDAENLVDAVAADREVSRNPWVIGADWNREPGSFALPTGSVFCPPNSNTYSVSDPRAKYDYCVYNGAEPVTGTVVGAIIMSDHFPDAFTLF